MDNGLISKIECLVKNACYQKENIFGCNIWEYHILPVVKYSKVLADRFCIDKECAILSAYLHDYASVLDKKYYEEHHWYGAKFAEEILHRENYPKQKIDIIKTAILNHRGSIDYTEQSLEIKCLASADAMAHITEIPSLLYLAYRQKNMDIQTGSQWVYKKINRSWDKLCEEAKIIIRDEYQAGIKVLAINDLIFP